MRRRTARLPPCVRSGTGEAERGGGCCRDGEAEQGLAADVLGKKPGDISAAAEQGRMAQRYDAGKAKQEVEGQREKREDGNLVEKERAVWKEKERSIGKNPEDDFGRMPAAPRSEQRCGLAFGVAR